MNQKYEVVLPNGRKKTISLTTIAINEDNNGPDAIAMLKDPHTRLCYASPEMLLGKKYHGQGSSFPHARASQ